jgi:hypothetical protein
VLQDGVEGRPPPHAATPIAARWSRSGARSRPPRFRTRSGCVP